MTLAIFKDVLKNKQVQILIAFLVVSRLAYSIFQHVGEVYLANDLGYEKSNLSSIKVLITPLNIILTAQVGYLARENPFGNMFKLAVLYILVSAWAVLGLLGTFPSKPEDQNSIEQYSHIFIVIFVLDLLSEFETTMMFGILFARTDKRISAVHVTIFAAMLNLTSFIHKTYIFFIVDMFGIFMP